MTISTSAAAFASPAGGGLLIVVEYEVIDRGAAAFAAEIAVLVADLPPAQRSRLSVIASRVVAADARRRGIDVHV